MGFGDAWKSPTVLVFQVKTANNRIDTEWKQHIEPSALFHDFTPNLPDKTYRPLDRQTEMPDPNTLIAFDSEFVSVRPPEIEINSDGARSTLRPTAHAIARASVVRGDGSDAGLAFIDDYVSIKEDIDDYLTAYSGITPADLDPQLTTRSLLPLKIVFKRLWLLSNLGCKFVGHGLKQDFRVLDMYIPKSQVIDTIELFHLKSRFRKLSLSFLAWAVLKERIQQETHDSIEDSRMALALYRKYLEWSDAGVLETMLQEVYKTGESTGFKVPKLEGGGSGDALGVPSRTDSPLVSGGAAAGPSTPSRRRFAGGSGGSGVGGASGSAMGGGGSPAWTPSTRSPFR